MKISDSLSIVLVSFVLVFGFLIVEGSFFPAAAHLRKIIPENTPYNWKELGEVYKYSANKIFDKGYFREIGPMIHPRLLLLPGGKPPVEGSFVLQNNFSESIVKFTLPKGFIDGILSLQITTESAYKIGVSYDLKNWNIYDYPGFGVRALSAVSLEKKESAGEYLYLKFLPVGDESLSVYFDVFQYTSALLYDPREYFGVLFFPEIDIDYEGKKIIQPPVYVKYDSKKNN